MEAEIWKEHDPQQMQSVRQMGQERGHRKSKGTKHKTKKKLNKQNKSFAGRIETEEKLKLWGHHEKYFSWAKDSKPDFNDNSR